MSKELEEHFLVEENTTVFDSIYDAIESVHYSHDPGEVKIVTITCALERRAGYNLNFEEISEGICRDYYDGHEYWSEGESVSVKPGAEEALQKWAEEYFVPSRKAFDGGESFDLHIVDTAEGSADDYEIIEFEVEAAGPGPQTINVAVVKVEIAEDGTWEVMESCES